MNAYPSGSNFMVAGDFNVQASSEGSYQMLIGYQTDNDGRSKDPINTEAPGTTTTRSGDAHAVSARGRGSGTGGGMDDRFDFVLVSYALDDGRRARRTIGLLVRSLRQRQPAVQPGYQRSDEHRS